MELKDQRFQAQLAGLGHARAHMHMRSGVFPCGGGRYSILCPFNNTLINIAMLGNSPVVFFYG